MRLDGFDIALRQRTAWEATDLGIALVRRHAGLIARSWLLFGLPLFVLVNTVCYLIDKLWLAMLLIWWLKPWFDQLVLHILSRAVFTTPPSPFATLRQQWHIRPILPWLLWRRIDLTRSLSMPVALLEGLAGRERRERSGVLARASTSPVAMGLCIVLLHIEAALQLSLFALVLMFVPYDFLNESAQIMFETLFEDPPRWAQVLVNGSAFVAMTLVEPFFVGAGFALYLNRRTQLEAWDIELAFRRIGQRIGAALLVFAVLPMLLLGGAGPAFARSAEAAETAQAAEVAAGDEDSEDSEDEDEEWTAQVIESRAFEDVFDKYQSDAKFADQIEKTLQRPEFGEKRTLMRWEKINPDDEPMRADNALIRALSALFGFLAKFGLWILLAAIIVLVILRAAHWRLPMLARRLRAPPSSAQVDADREEAPLPADLPAAARSLFARGAVRDAMALLYRGACVVAPARVGKALGPGATESDLIRLARTIDAADARDTIIDVVRQWQRTAYAADLPDAARFEQLLTRYAAAGFGAA